LHLGGIAFSILTRWDWGHYAVRAGGGGIALAGLMFLVRLT
jgi:urease accessory protein